MRTLSEIEQSALLNSSRTVYADSKEEIEELYYIVLPEIECDKEIEVVAQGKKLYIYRMFNGKYEVWSCLLNNRNGIQ